MLPGETLLSGADKVCTECQTTPRLGVYRSPAGHYIGSYCLCGPYSRESHYYASYQEAEKDLPAYEEALAGNDAVVLNVRTGEFGG